MDTICSVDQQTENDFSINKDCALSYYIWKKTILITARWLLNLPS